jgi:trk system potassium uptake protein TrkA
MTLLKLRKGEYSVVEEKVDPTALVVGKQIREVSLPEACTLIAVIRKGDLIVPHGDTRLEPVDEVLALVHVSQLGQLAALLGPQVAPRRG